MQTVQFRPILPFNAAMDIAISKIVKLAAEDGKVVQATAADDKLIGVAVRPAKSGYRIDVITSGEAPVKCGAAVARGDLLTVNANGDAVPVASAGSSVIGRALQSSVQGDTISVLIAISQGGPAAGGLPVGSAAMDRLRWDAAAAAWVARAPTLMRVDWATSAGVIQGSPVMWPAIASSSAMTLWTLTLRPPDTHPYLHLTLPAGKTLVSVQDTIDGILDMSRSGMTQKWISDDDFVNNSAWLVVRSD